MTGSVPLSLGVLCLAAVLAGRALAQVPPDLDASANIVTAEAPIVAGNAATAKQRALNDAFRQAVERVLAVVLAETGLKEPLPATLADLRVGLATRARPFVRSYRLLEQGEMAGAFRIQLEVAVDETLLRREVETRRGAQAATGAKGPALVSLVRTGSARVDAEGVSAAATALSAAGVKSLIAPEILAEDETASMKIRQIAGRARSGAVLASLALTTVEGPVRGTPLLAVQCRLGLRVYIPPPGVGSVGSPSERTVADRAFAETEEKARAACLSRAADRLVVEVVPLLSSAGGLTADLHAISLDLDLLEPAALGPVLRALKKIGVVSSSEVRRVVVGRVEVRVMTRATPNALSAALARELRGALDVSVTDTSGDSLTLRVRLNSGTVPEAARATP